MAGNKSIMDILGWVALTKAVNAVKDGVPNPFPPWLFQVKSENRVIGNSTKFNRVYGQRKTARVVKYGAAPRHRELQQEELVEAKLVHFYEERIFDPLILQVLRDYNSYNNADKAKQLVANNVKTLGTLFGNSRVVGVATSLAKGAIYADSDGNLLPTSSGATDTFSQNIPSANVGTVLDENGSGIFGASGQGSWANNATDIPKQLRSLQNAAALAHGYEPSIALYGKNIPSYLTQNDYVLDYLARQPNVSIDWIKDNTIPQGLFGFTWVPVWKSGFTKDDGTKVSLWPADNITFIPGEEDLDAWYSLFEGSYQVPTTLDITQGVQEMLTQMETVFGGFGYTVRNIKPVSLSACMGDTFLPGIKLPETNYLADTVA
jgi:hypothetical protein